MPTPATGSRSQGAVGDSVKYEPCDPLSLGAGNLTFGNLNCNEDYTETINSDYAQSITPPAVSDYVTDPRTIWSSAGQAGAQIYDVHTTPATAGTAAAPAVTVSCTSLTPGYVHANSLFVGSPSAPKK